MSAPDVLHQNARSSVVLSYHIVAMTQKKRAQLLRVRMVLFHMTRLSGYRKISASWTHPTKKNDTLEIQHGTSKLLSLKMFFLFQVVSFRFNGSFLGSTELDSRQHVHISGNFKGISESPERSFLISLARPISWFQHWLWHKYLPFWKLERLPTREKP